MESLAGFAYVKGMETVLDRLARRIRPAIFRLSLLAIPISVISYGKMLHDAGETWGGGAFAVAVIAQIITALTAAMLLDSRKERRSK